MNVSKINWRKQLFNWHMWAGIIFTIPILLISITAILIAHEKGLGTKEIAINAGWLPGYESQNNITELLNDVKSIHYTENATYYGTKIGVVIENKSKKLSILKGTEGKEIRDFLWFDNALWIASNKGILLLKNNQINHIKKGNIHGIDSHQSTLFATEGNQGFSISNDHGITWKSHQKISENISEDKLNEFLSSVNKSKFIEKISLQKLILDIHTGKAFVGNNGMWIWIDLIALALLLITFAGIWLWYKRTVGKKKRK